MNLPRRYTDYDALAWFYDRYWGDRFLTRYREAIRDHLLSRLKKGSAVLDLGCGTGHLTRWLAEEGYRTTGLDGSKQMLALARRNAPGVNLLCRDMRSFQIVSMFNGVICAAETINHIGTVRELGAVFNNVYTSLKPGGFFLFDVSTEDGLRDRWSGTESFIDKDHVLAAGFSFDEKQKTATARFAGFRYQRRWVRRNATIRLRAFSRAEVEARLAKSFFKNVKCHDAQRGLKTGEIGRLLFVCVR